MVSSPRSKANFICTACCDAYMVVVSAQAHDFIPAAFWHKQRAAMRDIYLPASKSWVYEEDGQLLGFISWYQGSVAALFISPNYQSHGLGRRLLDHLKVHYDRLELAVYAENERARRFYCRNGFKEGEHALPVFWPP